ncbi:alpha/beta hydrolase [Microbacterium sp. NPDC056044]|uniref:alpha/beta hydrolase n=1 Tax=Microbacterium sp. NPDC056044 TaxID=3345690 RepID=UPI0035E18803
MAEFLTGPAPAIDPELAPTLSALHAVVPGGLPSLSSENYAAIRAGFPGIPGAPAAHFSRAGKFDVEMAAVPGLDGGDIPLLICRPAGVPHRAAILYVHGGGMVLGSYVNGVDEMLDYADPLGLAVVSVDYRLAPEYPHPIPVEDCYASLAWLAEHATELDIPADRLIVAGESAGGGLAAATVLLARDRGSVAVFGQLLIAPMLDHRSDTPSMHLLQGAGMWDRNSNIFGWGALLGSTGDAAVSPYASPALAADLSGLPPTFIDVGGADAFRDEAIDYATRISQAGGLTDLHLWAGGYHGFDGMVPQAQISRSARATRLAWLTRLLAAAETTATKYSPNNTQE